MIAPIMGDMRIETTPWRSRSWARSRRRCRLRPRNLFVLCPLVVIVHVVLWVDFGVPWRKVSSFDGFAEVEYMCLERCDLRPAPLAGCGAAHRPVAAPCLGRRSRTTQRSDRGGGARRPFARPNTHTLDGKLPYRAQDEQPELLPPWDDLNLFGEAGGGTAYRSPWRADVLY